MNKYWYSLRFRFIAGSVVLLVLVLTGAIWAYQNIQQLRQTITDNLQVQRSLNENIRKIRQHLLDSSIHIEAYLLDPAIKGHRQRTFQSIEKSRLLIREIRLQPSSMLEGYEQNIDLLEQDIELLTEKTRHLFEVRDDADRQFPSLAVGNDVMQPNRNNLNNALVVAFNELREENTENQVGEVYRRFVEIRHLWSQLLSNFRLYLANRVGSFNENALNIQETAIDTMYGELRGRIIAVRGLDEKGVLGFQSSIAINDILTSLDNWYKGFIQVKAIHNSDGWRVDSKIMKQSIVPLLDSMSTRLTELENRMAGVTSRDVRRLAHATQRQTNVLMWGTGGILILMLLVFWSITRLVFRPLAIVVKALKAEASGMDTVLLPEARSQETAALVDSFNDMAKQVRKRQSDLEYQALHDALTGLPNRALLQERISHDILMARQDSMQISLLMLDIDRFKEVNDTLGHHVGDRLLIQIGKRIRSVIREADTIARLGGDEFAVVLTHTDRHTAVTMANKILQAMEQTIVVDSYELYVSLSIGVATYPEHGEDAAALLQHADVAMYNAKQSQAGYSIYEADEDNYSLMRLEMINDLRDAIDNDRLDLYFHPIIDLRNDMPCGLECLLRWTHPRFDRISPQQIIDLAEHTGLIHPLTFWVLKCALRQLQKIHSWGYEVSLSVNISAHNLRDADFFDKVQSLLDKYPVKKELLVFEITESAMMANPLRAAELLKQLDDVGIRLSVDDYGTGFSSLAYLKQLPVDELKIDRSFVSGMIQQDSDRTIVHSTIELAHNLGLQVVAEGAEDDKTVAQLRAWGCDRVQGYYYTRPLPLAELQHWFENFSPAGQNRLL